MATRHVYQFKISLDCIKPTIWRRIQISDLATFWDLHVAIQDSMGWFDCHLHQFTIKNPNTSESIRIGISDPDFDDMLPTKAGWDIKIREYFTKNNPKCEYEYDFGDGWGHVIKFEGQQEKIGGVKYPVCLDGENACPPEDVGGYWGYEDFVKIMTDENHERYDNMLEWFGEKYDPKKFDASKVKFSNARRRLNQILSYNGA
ncbi:plasmid pRiA4b ORF-3 family protein [Francisella sp. TX07-6608]|uniref:plasmid pRiA4b ORF-3 family protein n=1 Tax=Francisella sp. TX07-6608 TaxID=573568 RepID=UPI0008F9A32E|nr:plasmid pRiA4b ORF-3 family protein [Francisella sp. TX07-6608]OIN82957.1 hypothetical protein KX00_2073 [Francisella sp. TX07-6608]